MPISSEPGVTSRPSSVKTLVVGFWVNLAVSVDPPRVRHLVAHRAFGRADGVEQHDLRDPFEQLLFDLGRPHHAGRQDHADAGRVSYGSPVSAASSIAATIGLANASPTIVNDVARRRLRPCAAPRAGRGVRLVSVTTSPPVRCGIEGAEPQPGAVHQRRARDRRSIRLPASVMAATSGSDLVGRRRHALAEERKPERRNRPTCDAIVVHHALGHARGAAGVEHVDVVLAAGDALHRRRCAASTSSYRRAPATWPVAAVVDLDQQLELGQAVDDLGDPVAERRMEHQRFGVGSCRAGTTARRRGSGS